MWCDTSTFFGPENHMNIVKWSPPWKRLKSAVGSTRAVEELEQAVMDQHKFLVGGLEPWVFMIF